MSRAEAPLVSPCNSVCRIDECSGWCLGCYRTLDEIAAWSVMTEAQKLALRVALQARRRMARLESAPGKERP
jgi:uncharacterized protein